MRATLDKLISGTGMVLAVALVAATVLLFWASSFIGEQVDQQLSEQKIVMPTVDAINADEALSANDKKVMSEFAGSELDTGPEAKAYADNFIKAHLNHSTGGETYSTLGPKATAACGENRENATSPERIKVNAKRDTAFKGSTLRGLLLYGYAFATMGTIAGLSAWGALVLAAVMLLLALMGFLHAGTVSKNAKTPRSTGSDRPTGREAQQAYAPTAVRAS